MNNFIPYNLTDEQIELFLESASESLTDGLKAAEKAAGTKLTYVATEALMWMAGNIAEKMEVPWVAFWTGSSETLIAHLHTDLIRSTLLNQGSVSHANKTLDFVPCLSKYLVSNLPEGIVKGDLNSRFSIAMHGMAQNLPRANAVVMMTFEGLDPAVDRLFESKFTCYLPIGPLYRLFPRKYYSNVLEDYPHSSIPWLNHQEEQSVVYIAFGAVATPRPSELIALAEGFVDRAERAGKGFFVSWAPQLEVLRHQAVRLFLCDGEWNLVQQSMDSLVPIICRPFFGDHFMNAWAVSHVMGVGMELEKGVFTREEVVKLFREILQGEEGEKMRWKARESGLLVCMGINTNFEALVKEFFKC